MTDGRSEDDDLIAVVRAGLHELQPDVTHRVDHHRFWRDGRRRRQRRVALVTTSVLVTLAAVLVPLFLVALPDDDRTVATRPATSGTASRTPAAAVLSVASLGAVLRGVAPTATVQVSTGSDKSGVIAGSAVLVRVSGLVQEGTPATGISLQVSAFRVSSAPGDLSTLAYFGSVGAEPDLVQTRAGGGAYWQPRSGWDGFIGVRTGGGSVVVLVAARTSNRDVAPARNLEEKLADTLSRSSL